MLGGCVLREYFHFRTGRWFEVGLRFVRLLCPGESKFFSIRASVQFDVGEALVEVVGI